MPDWGTVLASADVGAGKTTSTKCEQCTTPPAPRHQDRPPLFGVVGRDRASIAGFDYSSAMKAKGAAGPMTSCSNSSKSPASISPAPR